MQIQPQTVHIVDDNPAVLHAVMRVLSSAGHQVRGYSSSEDFLEQHACDCVGCSIPPGCIIIDLALPGMTGLDLQQHLNRNGCAQPILFLTAKEDVRASVSAMRAGALNYLLKPIDAATLIENVEEALRRSARAHSWRAKISLILEHLSTLTARERQVFELIVEGRLNKQIAADFDVGEKTIKVHRARVMRKMGARTFAQLVHMADEMRAASDSHEEDRPYRSNVSSAQRVVATAYVESVPATAVSGSE